MTIYIPVNHIHFLSVWIVGLLSYYIYWYSGSETMAQTGLLIVSNISRASYFLNAASQHVKKTLYISLNPRLENVNYPSKFLSRIYMKSTSLCGNLEVRVLLRQKAVTKLSTMFPIDLVLLDNLPSDVEKDSFVTSHIGNLQEGYKVLSMDNIQVPSETVQQDNAVKKYEYVVLGGTFDRLHNGHKILLSEAIVRTTRQLTVGVTDTNMIKSKKLWELIEPVSVRISKLKEFLTDINPDLEYNVVPIDDMYGPTKDDPKLQLLVVSEETKRGGDKVNEKRKENGLPLLDVYTVELIEDIKLSEDEENKISSSNIRMRLLGSLLRPPQENDKIPQEPYVIGLSGGAAAGKTKITERLVKMGAGVVNCDLIAHELYQPGLPLNATIAQIFGPDVITANGEVDRKKLGQIVFSDKAELNKLNNALWPAILQEAQRRIQALGKAGHSVVVMEAAVMVQAGWRHFCHQLWAVIVPPEEAIKRLMSRNNLTEQQARDRVASQPDNLEQIAHANVVFSPFWKPDYTQTQVEKAWAHLQEYLAKRQSVIRQSAL